MKKSFLFNLIILFALNIFVKPFWLVLDMQVQVEVGEKYGLYAALLNLAAVLNIILDLGLSNYNNRKISIHPARFNNYFQNISIVRFGLAIVYTLVLMFIGLILGYEFEALRFLFLLGVSQVFLSSLLYVRSNFTAFGKYKLDSLFSVLDRVLMILGVLYLFANRGQGFVNLENFIYVQFFGYGISFFIALIVLFSLTKPQWPKLNKRFSKSLLKQSAPYALIVILMAAYHYSDSIMIERILPDGEAQNAIYAQSFRILMALNNYAYLFAVLLLPMFTKLIAKKQDIQGLLGASSSLLIYAVSALSILFGFYGNEIIGTCYGEFSGDRFLNQELQISNITNIEGVKNSAKVFQLLIIGIIPMSINYCFGTLITASGNMKVLNRIALFSLTANIVLNFILIPQQGAYGAAMASLVTQSLSGIGQMFFAVKLFSLKPRLVSIFRFLLGVTLVLVSTTFLNDFELGARLVLIAAIGGVGLLVSVDVKGLLGMVKGMSK